MSKKIVLLSLCLGLSAVCDPPKAAFTTPDGDPDSVSVACRGKQPGDACKDIVGEGKCTLWYPLEADPQKLELLCMVPGGKYESDCNSLRVAPDAECKDRHVGSTCAKAGKVGNCVSKTEKVAGKANKQHYQCYCLVSNGCVPSYDDDFVKTVKCEVETFCAGNKQAGTKVVDCRIYQEMALNCPKFGDMKATGNFKVVPDKAPKMGDDECYYQPVDSNKVIEDNVDKTAMPIGPDPVGASAPVDEPVSLIDSFSSPVTTDVQVAPSRMSPAVMPAQ